MSSDSTKPNTQQSDYGHEIDIRELFIVIWKGRFWIIGITFIAALISVAVALSLPNIYRSEALLAVEEEGGGALSGLASQYGGLANLAGISLPQGGSSEKSIGIETLKSRQFVTEFIERRDILPELIAANSFDRITLELDYDEGVYDPANASWTREPSPPRQAIPSPQEAYDAFMDVYRVSQSDENGFVRISIEHLSPVLAQQWVTWLVEDINEKMMLKATSEAQQSIDFLSYQLQNTQVVDLQEVFYSLIEEQTKTIMLASARPEYLFETIDPAIIPEDRISPNRMLIVFIGTALGGIASCFFLILYYAFKRGQV